MKKLWVFSLDALGDRDSALFETLPAFQRIMEKGAYIKHVRGVLPTLTYCSHATIITGRYPISHGIVNNRRFEPHRKRHEWFWFERDIHGDTLFKAAKRKGKKVAAFLWPVSAGAKIDSNFAEIFPTQPGQKQVIRSLMNSTWHTMLPIEARFGKLRDGVKQPNLDEYTMAATEYLIEKMNPDLLFVHLLDIDSTKHLYGTDSEETKQAIIRTGKRMEKIFALRDRRPDRESINLIFLSDHSQFNTPHLLYPLTDFQKKGYLEEKEEAVPVYRAYPHSCGGSCYVYLSKRAQSEKEEIRQFLLDYANHTVGIDAILFHDDIVREGGDANAFAMLEARKGFAFSENFKGTEAAKMEKERHRANHGYHPDKPGYDALFFAEGPDIMPGVVVEERMQMIDFAPTIARMMDLDLQGSEGKVMEMVLKKEVLP